MSQFAAQSFFTDSQKVNEKRETHTQSFSFYRISALSGSGLDRQIVAIATFVGIVSFLIIETMPLLVA